MTAPRSRSVRTTGFRFLDLPAELRTKIYQHHLLIDHTIDLDPASFKSIGRRLNIFRACRQVHEEAYPVFYGSQTFRVFPTHGDYIRSRHVLLSRLSPRYRAVITCLELRLGPCWSSPPRSWTVTPCIGLRDTTSVRTLTVFIECDPSHEIFRGFRRGKDFFTLFSAGLLKKLISALPSLESVRFDAYPSVSRDGALMSKLSSEASNACKAVCWGSTLSVQTLENV